MLHATVVLLSTHSLDPCLWGSPIIPLFVHQPAAPSLQRGLSTNQGMTAYVGEVEEMVGVAEGA